MQLGVAGEDLLPLTSEISKMSLSLSSTIKLNDGVEMPLFGLGMYLSEPGQSSAGAVTAALKNGYKLIDTAIYYK